MSTVKGRWGFYPCDYDTYRKLKKLSFFLLEAQRRLAAYNRWDAKQPQNRILYKRTLVTGPLPGGGEGQFKIKEAIGPAPEPITCCFTSNAEDNQIGHSYMRARYPAQTEGEVKPLTITVERVDALLAQFEEWYAKKDMVCV